MIIRFSTKAVKNNDWKISKYMKKYAKKMLLMYTPDKDLEEARLSLNPVPSNLLSKETLDDCLLETLIEWGGKTTSF